MEQYKEKLKKQNIVLSLCIGVLAVCAVLPYAAEAGLFPLTPVTMDSHWQSMWRGFVSGGSTGILGLMVFILIRNLLAIRDDKKLKKLYVKMHDERTIQLFHNARSAAMTVFLIGGLIAVIVTGYWSATVSITILVCVMVCSSMCMWFKLYYDRKY